MGTGTFTFRRDTHPCVIGRVRPILRIGPWIPVVHGSPWMGPDQKTPKNKRAASKTVQKYIPAPAPVKQNLGQSKLPFIFNEYRFNVWLSNVLRRHGHEVASPVLLQQVLL